MGREMAEIKFTKNEYTSYGDVRKNKRLDAKSQDIIAALHAKYFNHQFYKPCSCSGKTWQQWVSQLNDIYDNGHTDRT